MTCDEAEVMLHALIDGELDAGHAREVESHIEGCPRCAAALHDYGEISSAIADAGVSGAFAAVTQAGLGLALLACLGLGLRFLTTIFSDVRYWTALSENDGHHETRNDILDQGIPVGCVSHGRPRRNRPGVGSRPPAAATGRHRSP